MRALWVSEHPLWRTRYFECVVEQETQSGLRFKIMETGEVTIKSRLQKSNPFATCHFILSCTISHVLFYISVFLFLVLSSIHCFPSILNCLPYITPLLESSSVQCTLSFHNFLLSLKSCMSFSQQSYFPSCLPRLVSSYLCPQCLVSNNTCLKVVSI